MPSAALRAAGFLTPWSSQSPWSPDNTPSALPPCGVLSCSQWVYGTPSNLTGKSLGVCGVIMTQLWGQPPES